MDKGLVRSEEEESWLFWVARKEEIMWSSSNQGSFLGTYPNIVFFLTSDQTKTLIVYVSLWRNATAYSLNHGCSCKGIRGFEMARYEYMVHT